MTIRTLHEGEELVRRILDAVPGGVVHVARDGSIKSANADALAMLGYRFDDVTKRFIADWEPETLNEDGTPCAVTDYPVAQVLGTGKESGPRTIGVRRPDGKLIWAVFRAVPIRDAEGNLDGAVVTFLDITERKQAEERVRRSEERWRSLAEHLPDFVCLIDSNERIVSMNRILAHLSETKVIGASIYDFLDPAHVDDYRTKLHQTVDEKRPTRLETRGIGRDGKIVWYETVLIPLVEDKEVARVLIVARDITERRAMLANLAEKERLASVGMLAASIAHEIMNPLTYVLGNLDFALSERCTDDARRTKALTEAREGAGRMQQIVWDLRALGRAGAQELFYVDARAVLETALRLSGPEVGRTARVILDLGEIPGVFASESRLCQVFINLLVNAAQALEQRPQAEREIRVRTRHNEAESFVGIVISDNGHGIAREHLDRIFEPFYTTKRSGTGLGLSISRDIVNAMGGRIEVESVLDQGTTFTVWLSTMRDAKGAKKAREASETTRNAGAAEADKR